MKIIWKVLIKEIRQKPGRFVTLTAGMTASIFLITVMTVFSSSCLHAMILQEKKENGPYEAIFHDLTPGQAASLSEDPQIRQVWTLDQCPEESGQTSAFESSASGRVCCGVSFKRISLSVFKRSQEVGEAIVMDVLPEEERPILMVRTKHTVVSLYDITFNEEGEGDAGKIHIGDGGNLYTNADTILDDKNSGKIEFESGSKVQISGTVNEEQIKDIQEAIGTGSSLVLDNVDGISPDTIITEADMVGNGNGQFNGAVLGDATIDASGVGDNDLTHGGGG